MRYFQYYIREDDWSYLLCSSMLRVMDVGKEPECRRVKSRDRELFNWLPKLSYFRNDYFLVAASLLILQNILRVFCTSPVRYPSLSSDNTFFSLVQSKPG